MKTLAKPNEGSPWKPMAERHVNREAKRAAVLQTAAELFIKQGFIRTRLTDVAEKLNITKPALYNYFRSKEEILLACFEVGNALIDDSFDQTIGTGFTGLQRILQFVDRYVHMLTQPFGACIIMLDLELEPEPRAVVRKQKRDLDHRLRVIMQNGILDGSIRKDDPKLLVYSMMGMLNWVAYWFQPEGPMSSDQIAEHMKQSVSRLLQVNR